MKLSNYTVKAAQLLEDQGGIKLDANETAMLERELTQMRTKVFQVEYPDLIARSLLPIATDIAPSAETFAYKVWDRVGKAKVGANDSDDPPRIDVLGREVQGKVFPIIASFGYGLNEIENAARVGTRLDEKKAQATRDAIEEGIDHMLAFGNTGSPGETNLVTRGILNHPDIEGVAGARILPITNWTTATTAADMVAGLNSLINAPFADSKDRFAPTDIVLPSDKFRLIASKPYGVDSDRTVLSWFTTNHNIRITSWYRAVGLGTNSTGRAIVYRKDPMVLEGVVPKEYTQLPPQARNYELVIPTVARCGGVKVYQPMAVRYGDFAA